MTLDLDCVAHVCPCGSRMWFLHAMFDDYEIGWYSREMTCALCGARALSPTPLDRPDEELS